MDDIVRSIILGVVQGLTEFLPVSSSGHLEILNTLLGSSESIDSDLSMVILVHIGTALSILYVYRRDILDILKDIVSLQWTDNTRLSSEIILSMLPALVVGLMFEDQIEKIFSGGIWMVGAALIFTGLVLWATPSLREQDQRVGWKRAILLGLAQAVAIFPGISRSGMTIAAALMLGVGKKEAARFSFLMVLPVILGKAFLDIIGGEWWLNEMNMLPTICALLASMIVGIIACKWMIRLVQRSSLRHFAVYCISIGAIVIGSSIFYG